MDLANLLVWSAEYYRDRGFPASAIANLQRSIVDHVEGTAGTHEIGVLGSYQLSPPKKVSDLLKKLPRRPLKPNGDLTATKTAIFGFAFGYRLKSRIAPGEERRLPGPNNRRLAEICANLKRLYGNLKICAQFEIADALADYTDVRCDVSTRAQNIGTKAVVKQFLKSLDPQPQTIVVVAHRHHLDRCHIILREDLGLATVDADESYDGYDPLEAQDRVKSAEDFIVSDFISLAAR